MPFRPNVNDELILNDVYGQNIFRSYRIAEHPAAPGIPYGQEGRAGIVYQLIPSPSAGGEGLPSPLGRGAGGEGKVALKVFKPRFRTPALVSQAEKLAAFADLPGLTVCKRMVLTRTHHADLLQRHPDLIYAVLMPWIEGPTWQEVLLEKRPLTPQQALELGRAFALVLETMEVRGLAHCDLSAPNLLLPALATPRSALGSAAGLNATPPRPLGEGLGVRVSILNPHLRFDADSKRVFHLSHLSHQIRIFN